MKRRDGFEVVNALCRDEVSRRSVLRALGWSAAAASGWFRPAGPCRPGRRSRRRAG